MIFLLEVVDSTLPVFGRLPEPNGMAVSCLFFTLDQSAFGILIT